ncbi:hypothetical protein AB0I07_35180, partial [Polymorphospora rubra]
MSSVAFYVQLADLLAKQIEEAKLHPRQPRPSEATLQQEYGVARGTVRQRCGCCGSVGWSSRSPGAARTSPIGRNAATR